MASEIIALLVRANVAGSLAILAVLVLRHPIRRGSRSRRAGHKPLPWELEVRPVPAAGG